MATLTNDQWQEALVQLANSGMPITNVNANGQTTMSASAPVAIASDQSAVAVKGAATGGAVPAQAFYIGFRDFAGNLDGIQSAGSLGNSGTGTDAIFPTGEYGYVGGGLTDMLRTPNTFKTATATATGNTAVWTPTSGKKFRLMRLRLDLPANAAISGGGVIVDITFQDATTDMGIGISVFVPTTAVTTTMGGFTTGWIDLGNGRPSAAANNVLNVNLSATLTAGKVRVSVAGTEE